MAEVWVATDLDLDRQVAVKWLKNNLAFDPIVAERFRREAIAVARLSHPNIVAVHDVCLHEGRQAVIMQLVDGKSLRQLLDTQARLGPELTIHIGACIAGALDEAHRAGFVHRDVKPANILVTSDGRVLLTDFGIAKGLQSGDDDLTSENVMMGTAKYLSPEQVRGHRLDGRADLYSLGLVLYECLAGRVPFLGESDTATALARLQRDPTDLAHLRPTLPIGLVNLIHQTLARNPSHRPASGADLRAALQAVDTTPPQIDRTPVEPPARLAHPPRKALGAGPGIPGEPGVALPPTGRRGEARADDTTPRVTGTVPPRHRSAPPGDTTPAAPRPVRGAPARSNDQRWGPSLIVVGGMLATAIVVAFVLFIRVNRGDVDEVGPTATTPVGELGSPVVGPAPVISADASDASDTSDLPTPVVPSDDATIVRLTAWDPDGDNATENDALTVLALADGEPSSYWPTECYQDQYLGAKRGVGLIVELSNPVTGGTVSVTVDHGPYQLDVFTSSGSRAPTDLDGWERSGSTRYADEPETVEVDVPENTSHVLLWLKQLGLDDACSSANPYRGRLAEISFRS